MTRAADTGQGAGVEEQASDWWSRMRGPDADRSRAAFEAWLANPVHRSAYARRERAWSISEGLGATAMGRNRSLESYRPASRLFTVPRVAAAGVAAAALLTIALFQIGNEPDHRVAATMLSSALGEVRAITLSDGTRVILDTDTEIRVRFTGDIRRVELVRGRARFDVRGDRGRLFVVRVGDAEASVSDGRFDAAIMGGNASFTAWQGALDLNAAVGAPARISAGRTAFLPLSGTGPGQIATTLKGREFWTSGMLVYRSAPLAEVLAETNRYSREKILLGETSIGRMKVTGTFRPIPADALAASLAAAFGLKVTREATGNYRLDRGQAAAQK